MVRTYQLFSGYSTLQSLQDESSDKASNSLNSAFTAYIKLALNIKLPTHYHD